MAARGRGPPFRPADDRPTPGRDTHRVPRSFPRIHGRRGRPVAAAHDPAGDHAAQIRRGRAGPAGGSRTRLRNRQTLRDRRHVVWVHLSGSPRNHGHRHEHAGGAFQYGRGRGVAAAPARPAAELRDQAGGIGAVRRHRGLPEPCPRHPDQDGAGCETGRGRAVAVREGLPLGCEGTPLHPGRRADLSPTPPRHIFD